MKKIYSFLVAMLFSVVAFAYDVYIDGICYNLDTENKTAEVTYRLSSENNYSGMKSCTIPSTIFDRSQTYRVTSIGEKAFIYCSSLVSIEIPNSVTSIGKNAFAECTSLSSIKIPNSITLIEYGAFAKCASLSSVKIPNSVTSIGDYAFYGCSSLASIEIPNSVT